MGDGFFNFSLWDVINHPALKLTGKAMKLGANAVMSASTKEVNNALAPSELLELLQNAQAGDSDAQVHLALYYAEKQDFDKATYWLFQSAQQGNEYALGIIDSLQE